MGQRVQEHVPHGREAVVGLQAPVLSATAGGPRRTRPPRSLVFLIHASMAFSRELEEDALAPDLGGRHPLRVRPAQRHPLLLGEVADLGVVAGRLDPGEPDQGTDLPQPLGQDDLLQDLAVRLRRLDDPELEVPAVQARVGVREDLPLGLPQVGDLVLVLVRWPPSSLDDRLPDLILGVSWQAP